MEEYDNGNGQALALTTQNNPQPGFLNIDQAVMIAATYGQEAIVLDYSTRPVPRVMSTSDQGWVEVAHTFG